MNGLDILAFREFFSAVHGCEPFPWQERLLLRVLSGERPWPEAITLPTASGKTSCIDIALFALAAQADRPAAERTATRRIAFVVDRRIVVDEAFERAKKIAKALREAETGVVFDVASRLRIISGDKTSDPLGVVSLRGGIARDQTWARSATQPLVICSTVDQIGSRLLFRGYGLSDRALPIHAGLVGNDILILLDEAHIAEPFLQTARAVEHYRRNAPEPMPLPFHFVVMSATPPATADAFPASQDELDPDRQHPVLGSRWKAKKPTALAVAEGTTRKNFWSKLAQKIADEAAKLVGEERKVIAVIVNRVATAKGVHEILRKAFPDRCILVTGRMRPVDQNRVMLQAGEKFMLSTGAASGRNLHEPVFIVATQCLEVGADMDFDGLITECASFDALRQRFGRLNRGGRDIQAKGAIIVRGDQVEPPKDPKDIDPVYGPALSATWKWLTRIAVEDSVDFGIEAMRSSLSSMPAEEVGSLSLAPVNAPVMMPAHVDVLCQTSPLPVPSPDISIFLHGQSATAPEVSLCWRMDISSDMPTEEMAGRLSLCPPAAAECLNVPLWRVRGWIEAGAPLKEDNELTALEADAPVAEPEIIARGEEIKLLPLIFCWRGDKVKSKSISDNDEEDDNEGSFILRSASSAKNLHRGDTLVLSPESAGFWLGEDLGALDRLDQGDAMQLTARARPTIRLHPKLIETWPDSKGKSDLLALCSANDLAERLEASSSLRDDIVEHLRSVEKSVEAARFTDSDWLKCAASCLITEFGDLRRFERAIYLGSTSGNGVILRATRRWQKRQNQDGDELFPESGFASSRSSRTVTLKEHTDGVERHARSMASAAGISISIAEFIVLAAQFHDLGKADPRFQAMLLGLAKGTASGTPLAKSARLPVSRHVAEEQRQAAGYPKGGRHELLSVRLAEASGKLPAEVWQRDLVMHLIAAHHGFCRPWAPVVFDQNVPITKFDFNGGIFVYQGPTDLEKLDSGVAERFWRLTARFGVWGLAYLESLLRLADQKQSAVEQITEDEAI